MASERIRVAGSSNERETPRGKRVASESSSPQGNSRFVYVVDKTSRLYPLQREELCLGGYLLLSSKAQANKSYVDWLASGLSACRDCEGRSLFRRSRI